MLQPGAALAQADGLHFLCPKCLEANAFDPRGVHSVLCWTPKVPADIEPRGRWFIDGASFDTLTLRGLRSDSVLLTSPEGCMAHFYVRNGRIEPA